MLWHSPAPVTSPPTHASSPSHSQVTHEDISSRDIVYLVSSPPSSGFLTMLQHSQDVNEQPSRDPIQSFTQEDINSGRVLYLHSKPNEERDRFVLDITARSADPLEGVVVSLVVLPITVPLDVHNITVPGGGSATISSSILHIPNAYYPALGMEFSVLQPPRFGTLLSSQHPEQGGLHSFTWSEVQHPPAHQAVFPRVWREFRVVSSPQPHWEVGEGCRSLLPIRRDGGVWGSGFALHPLGIQGADAGRAARMGSRSDSHTEHTGWPLSWWWASIILPGWFRVP